MSNTSEELSRRVSALSETVRKLQERLTDISNPFLPETVSEARTRAVEALDDATDSVDAVGEARNAQANALGSYNTAMRRHLSGDLRAKPAAPSLIKLEQGVIEALGLASAKLSIAGDLVKTAETLATSDEAQAAARDSARVAYAKAKAPAREAFEAFMDAYNVMNGAQSTLAKMLHEAGLTAGVADALRRDRHRPDDQHPLDVIRAALSTEGQLIKTNEWLLLSDEELRESDPQRYLGAS